MIIYQRYQIFKKINNSTDFKWIVSQSNQSRMRIEYRIYKVVDACPKVLLQNIGL